jgi:ABC-2 type transport system permease protein
MNGIIFLETLRRTWKGTLLWAVGIASMVVYVVAVIPDSQTLQQYAKLIETMPKFIALVGGSDMALMATPAGFLGYTFFGWIMVLLAFYAVLAGLALTANEEDRGILDVMLSLPVPRVQMVVEKFAAYAVNMLVIALVSFVTMWVVTTSNPLFKIEIGRMLIACLNLIPAMLLTMAFTGLIAVVVRRRTTAIGIASAFVIGSYLIDVVGRSANIEGGLRFISFFTYYDGGAVLAKGAQYGGMALLIGLALVLLAGSTVLFQRRDVGV